MNYTITLQTIKAELKSISSNLSLRLDIAKLDDFILGSCTELDATTASKVISGFKNPSKTIKSQIIMNGTWTWNQLENAFRTPTLKSGLKKEFYSSLKIFYSGIFPIMDSNKKFDILMKELVYQAIFHTQFPILFPDYRKQPCKYYIRQPQKEAEIENALIQNNIIIVLGDAGIGKSQLVKSYIKNMSQNNIRFEQISWNELLAYSSQEIIKENIEEHLKRMKHDKQLYVNGDIIKALQSQERTTLLVLELPVMTDEDCNYLISTFYRKDIRIIVTTRKIINQNCLDDKHIPVIKCLPLPEKALKEMFQEIVGIDSSNYFSDEEFTDLLETTSSNTLAIRVLAKSIRRLGELSPELKNDLLNINKWRRSKSRLKEVNERSYIDNPDLQNPIYFLQLILYKFKLIPKELEREYSELAIWANYEIPVSALDNWTMKKWGDKISQFVSLGILDYEDEEKSIIKMPHLIADVIWLSSPISYPDYRAEIQYFASTIGIGQKWEHSYSILYNTMWNLIFRFCFSIGKTKQYTLKEEWWNFVSYMIEQFVSMGNADMAKRIFNQLKQEVQLEKSSKNYNAENEEIIIQQLHYLTFICLKIQIMIGDKDSGALFDDFQEILEENPASMYHILIFIMEWCKRYIESNDHDAKSMLTTFIFWKKVLDLYIKKFDCILSFICKETTQLTGQDAKECLAFTDTELRKKLLYFQGTYCLFANFHIFHNPEISGQGYECLNYCLHLAQETNDIEMTLNIYATQIYLELFDVLLSGQTNSNIEKYFATLEQIKSSTLLSWKLSILFNHIEILYKIYTSRVSGNINELKGQIREISSLFDDQIVALSDQEKSKLNEAINKCIESLDKLNRERKSTAFLDISED